MNQSFNEEGGVSRLIGKVAAEKKKAGIALCLIAIMAVMWVKVLTKKGPEISKASPVAEATDDSDLDEAINITYVDLPRIPDRDDLISRDFFASEGWEDFRTGDATAKIVEGEDFSIEKTGGTKAIAGIVAQHIKLGAIIMEERPQAFINDKFRSAGDTLTLTDGSETYECEVVEVRKNSVLIRCKDAEIVLKLIETAEGDG